MVASRLFRTSLSFALAIPLIACVLQPSWAAEMKRPVTIKDSIEFTRLADSDYFLTGHSDGKVAQFSPDGKRFVVVLRRANISENVNEYSIHLFYTADAARPRGHEVILTMKSSSNRPAIRDWKWLNDSRTLVFIGENPKQNAQLYQLDTATRHLARITHLATSIEGFRVTGDGRHFVFLADAQPPHRDDSAIVITDQRLDDLLQGKTSIDPNRLELFTLRKGGASESVPSEMIWNQQSLSVSPDGRYAVLGAQQRVRDLPMEWSEYQYPHDIAEVVSPYFHARYKAAPTPFLHYVLLDVLTHRLTPLWDGPQVGPISLSWSNTSRSLLLRGVFLPLTGSDPENRKSRTIGTHTVEMSIPDAHWKIVTEHESPVDAAAGTTSLKIAMEEDINTPPRIYAEQPDGTEKVLLIDLNPRLAGLALGRVETVSWKVKGIELLGGLYFPPDYKLGNRYPLVIQTHGYVQSQFSMDGRNEWSSSFAARSLAAKGILVLQVNTFAHPADSDLIGNDRSLGATPNQSRGMFQSLAYDAVIDELVRRGLVDEGRIGISGFSRTVWFVSYALTHSRHQYRAAILTDGIDAGYFQYLSYRATEFEQDNGGSAPFGAPGLEQWLTVSPGFNLDNVQVPVRLVALNLSEALQSWEWFAGLQLQGKPVDFVALRGGAHLLQRPSDRDFVMQGIVDWFDFWLCGQSDSIEAKESQYRRWSTLKATQQLNQGTLAR